jgi:hypothetical protein
MISTGQQRLNAKLNKLNAMRVDRSRWSLTATILPSYSQPNEFFLSKTRVPRQKVRQTARLIQRYSRPFHSAPLPLTSRSSSRLPPAIRRGTLHKELFMSAIDDAVQHPHEDKKYVTNVNETLRKIDSAPSTAHPDPKKAKQIPVDLVEEESMESFPASDPPSHTSNRRDKEEPRRPGQEE